MLFQRITLAVVLFAGSSSSLRAHSQYEQWFKKSFITLTDLSEAPGVVLEPGTYVLKAEEGVTGPKTVVQLLNQDETQILATFIAVPDHRARPDFDAVITFFPNITSGPKPIQTWFYLGEMNGYEFVYPKARAKEIAKLTDDHVMGSEGKDNAIFAITQNGTEVPIWEPPGTSKARATEDAHREKPQPPATPAKRPKRTPPKL